jgi:hypothetical protein
MLRLQRNSHLAGGEVSVDVRTDPLDKTIDVLAANAERISAAMYRLIPFC